MGNAKGPQANEAARSFGQNLARLRQRAGLSQEGAGDRAGLHRTHVAMIEAGKRLPRLDTIVKLGGAVGWSPAICLRAWPGSSSRPRRDRNERPRSGRPMGDERVDPERAVRRERGLVPPLSALERGLRLPRKTPSSS